MNRLKATRNTRQWALPCAPAAVLAAMFALAYSALAQPPRQRAIARPRMLAPQRNTARTSPQLIPQRLPQAQAAPTQAAPIVRQQSAYPAYGAGAPRVGQSGGVPPLPLRQPPVVAAPVRPAAPPPRASEAQQHLAEWMEAHRNLPLADQHRALDNERGFRNQTPEEQERLHQRLTQLNAMPEDQRRKLIQRTEAMERLTPAQRQQYRSTATQLGNLPEDRRNAVFRTFHAAVDMPEPQRQAWLNSPSVRNQFNDREREALNNLISIQPAAAQAGLPGFAPRAAAPLAPR